MAFGANSKVFVTWAQSVMGQGQTAAVLPAAYGGLGADTINVALYNNTGTPSETDTLAHAAYNGTGGPWVTANEVTDATNWTAGGRTLASKTLNVASNVFTFDAADTSGAGNVTISNAYGCLVYDNTITAGTGGVAKQGVCFNSFGGAQSVTAGTFTIVWNASGIFNASV